MGYVDAALFLLPNPVLASPHIAFTEEGWRASLLALIPPRPSRFPGGAAARASREH